MRVSRFHARLASHIPDDFGQKNMGSGKANFVSDQSKSVAGNPFFAPKVLTNPNNPTATGAFPSTVETPILGPG